MDNIKSNDYYFIQHAEINEDEIEDMQLENEEVYKWMAVLLFFVWLIAMFM